MDTPAENGLFLRNIEHDVVRKPLHTFRRHALSENAGSDKSRFEAVVAAFKAAELD